jgi:REP element-mobilizing transposase RayT
MWNGTDTALAYLITFRCYGTWLHGDDRGSVDRFHNQYAAPYIAPDKNWRQSSTRRLKHEPVTLDADQRASVERGIRETCELRQWLLRAAQVRTNHVHVVVSIGAAPVERTLNALKANTTRQMRQDGRWPHQHSPWANRGSTRYLWNQHSIERAIDYVTNSQGSPLPELD